VEVSSNLHEPLSAGSHAPLIGANLEEDPDRGGVLEVLAWLEPSGKSWSPGRWAG
jgi:hypothetical protein